MLCAQGGPEQSRNPSNYLPMKQLKMRKGSSVSTDRTRQYSTSTTFNITVLISGSGTNLQALIDACQPGKVLNNARITHVISNRNDAYGLERAKNAGIYTSYHNLVSYKKKQPDTEAGTKQARDQYDVDLAQIITTRIPAPDLVVCAGWMHILSKSFITALKSADIAIINLHPALPGEFSGANAIERAYEAFQKGEVTGTGVMVHHVINEIDAGKPVVVKDVPIKQGETLSELETRIHEVEWRAIVDGTWMVLRDLEEKRNKEGR
jgi:phosphoribosylglycinamide formyltransferase